MNSGKVRSYSQVAERILRAASKLKSCCLTLLGEIEVNPACYPVYSLFLSPKEGSGLSHRGHVCLSAGIHGDEPAGVEAILALMENPHLLHPYLDDLDFTLLPCINPSGYERGTRTNFQDLDLNRNFGKVNPPPEIRFVQQALADKQIDLSMEFHEDVDTDGFYLYEIKARKPYFGEAIVQEVARHWAINLRDRIEDLPSAKGVIRLPQHRLSQFRQRGWPQTIYLYRNGARHCITCETPVHLPLPERAQIHLTALVTSLKQMGSRRSRPA